MKTSGRPLHQLMDRLLTKTEHEGVPSLADALGHCVMNVTGETAGCPLSQLFLLDYAASERGDPDHLKRTIGDRLHTLLMGEAIWGKNTRYLDMLLSCEHFAQKDAACTLHQILKIKQPFSPLDR